MNTGRSITPTSITIKAGEGEKMIMARKTSTAVTMLGMELIIMKPVTPMLVTRFYNHDKDVSRYLGV